MTGADFLIVHFSMIGVSTLFMFVALGECLTETSGCINLGHEGNLVLGAMVTYGVSFTTGSPWTGVVTAGGAGLVPGAMHGWVCALPRLNDIAVGIAFMSFGTGLAFFFGKRFTSLQPQGWKRSDWVTGPASRPSRKLCRSTRSSLSGLRWRCSCGGLSKTRWGLILRMTGDSAASARAMGVSIDLVRLLATAAGGLLAGIGGAFLSHNSPGSWNEGLSSGQGLMAVALVIFARWDPLRCIWAAPLFGTTGALGPSVQSIGFSQGYCFFNAAPCILTLCIMIASARSKSAASEAPRELSIVK